MSARDELSTTILHHPWLPDDEGLYTGLCPSCPSLGINGGHNSPSHAYHLADAILADDYHKPRIITTREEVEALGNGAVIVDSCGDVAERRDGLWCSYETAPMTDGRLTKYQPLTVLREGTQP